MLNMQDGMKGFMLPGIRFPSDGCIDPGRMPDTPLPQRLLDRMRACPWVMCRSDRYGEHAEQLQEFRHVFRCNTTRAQIKYLKGSLQWLPLVPYHIMNK